LILTNQIDKAKKEAYKYLRTPLGKEMVELFKNKIPDPVVCKCGKKVEQRFSKFLLKYIWNAECLGCAEKAIEVQRQKHEKMINDKLFAFTEKKEEIILNILLRCGVPPNMVIATISNLPKPLLKELDSNSYFFTSLEPGPGKTYTSIALMAKYLDELEVIYNQDRYTIDIGVPPIFITVSELLLDIRSAFNESSADQERDLIYKYTETPFLILDDMGVEKATEWALQTLYIIINRRHDDSSKTTVITSNLTLDEISSKFNGRIGSRINGMCKTLTFKGKDRRQPTSKTT